jgi:hypothetical protein
MRLAGVPDHDLPLDIEIDVVFYGDLFRPPGRKSSGEPPYDVSDIDPGFEQELLEAWWLAAAVTDPQVPGATGDTKLRTPNWVQRALNQLSQSAFFAGLTEQAFIGSLKQVRAYFTEPGVRAAVQSRAGERVDERWEVVIGHSLGSVVAYEALCAHPEWPVRRLVTLGSPLGVANLVFDRLSPPPVEGRGTWPGSCRGWTNVADAADVVALVKELAPRFGDAVQDVLVHNGARAHDVAPYLTARETGSAVAVGLGLLEQPENGS